jgi:hypothetical protein
MSTAVTSRTQVKASSLPQIGVITNPIHRAYRKVADRICYLATDASNTLEDLMSGSAK